jgi:DNA-binding beta-propeller fold protein YncE
VCKKTLAACTADTSTCGPLGTFAVGTGPAGIAFDGTNMWVTNEYDGTVTKLSPTGATLGTFPVGDNPAAGMAFDGTNMWVSDGCCENVTKVSPSGATLGAFVVGESPQGIAFDGAHMWVAVQDYGEVIEL